MSAGIIACLAHVFSGLNIFVANQHQPVLCCAGAAPSLISLYFSYGLLLPIALAAIHTGWIVAVQKEFPETRGAATGLLMTGGGAGLFHSESESLGGGERKETRKQYGSTISCIWGEAVHGMRILWRP